jgi:hypothetical protein
MSVDPSPSAIDRPQLQQAFAVATAWFQEVLGQVGDRWAQPGLGEWDVPALAGYTVR